MTKSPVIVVGRGLAGLTTAMCLARRKIPVKVFYDALCRGYALLVEYCLTLIV